MLGGKLLVGETASFRHHASVCSACWLLALYMRLLYVTVRLAALATRVELTPLL